MVRVKREKGNGEGGEDNAKREEGRRGGNGDAKDEIGEGKREGERRMVREKEEERGKRE